MADLTKRLEAAWSDPIAGEEPFDLTGELESVLSGVGLAVDDAGGAVTTTGADPVVPSTMRIGGAATIGLLAKSVAAAAVHRWRGGPGQDVHVDLRRSPHRLCPFYDRRWERLGRYPVASSLETGNAMAFSFFRCADGRWVMPQNMYAGLRQRAQELLGVPLTKERVAAAIGEWTAPELETAAAEAGVVMPMLRTVPEFLAETQYRDVLADLPLIELTKVGDAPPTPLSPAGIQPFSGAVLSDLGRDADVFFHNRRQQFLHEIGFGPEQACAERPGLVYVTVSLHGLEGPWAGRPGFDQSAGSSSRGSRRPGSRRRCGGAPRRAGPGTSTCR